MPIKNSLRTEQPESTQNSRNQALEKLCRAEKMKRDIIDAVTLVLMPLKNGKFEMAKKEALMAFECLVMSEDSQRQGLWIENIVENVKIWNKNIKSETLSKSLDRLRNDLRSIQEKTPIEFLFGIVQELSPLLNKNNLSQVFRNRIGVLVYDLTYPHR